MTVLKPLSDIVSNTREAIQEQHHWTKAAIENFQSHLTVLEEESKCEFLK
jgi:hypothetical protein